MAPDILQHLNVTRDLLAGPNPARLASNIVSDELVPTARLAIDSDLFSAKLWNQPDGCICTKSVNQRL